MRKILILLILLYGHLYALEKESTLKIYHDIFSALSSRGLISVYTNDREYREVFRHSKKIILSKNLEEADIVLITNEVMLKLVLKRNKLNNHLNKKPIYFVTDYKFLGKSVESVGAFYWRKGRSQLLFVKKRLDEQNITLPRDYQKFIIDEL